MNYLLPLPDAEGIAQTKAWFLQHAQQEISDTQAADILGRLMKYLYLTSDTFMADKPPSKPADLSL